MAATLATILLEIYHPTKSKDFDPASITEVDIEFMRIKYAIEGCQCSLVRFFKNRIPCSCLDEKYASVKSQQPKTGLCDQCGQRQERKALMVCSHCNAS